MKAKHRRQFNAAMALRGLTFKKVGAMFKLTEQTVCNVCSEPPRRRNPVLEKYIAHLIGLPRDEVFPPNSNK